MSPTKAYNHLYIMGIMGYSKNSESVLPLQLNFDSNAQIKKLKKKRGTLTFFVSKMFEEKNGVTLYCALSDSYSGLYFMGKSSKNIEKNIDQPLDSGRCCLSIRLKTTGVSLATKNKDKDIDFASKDWN